MAIKFTENDGGGKPAKKEAGGKAYVAEEPSAGPDPTSELPFAKAVRAEKRGAKIRNRPAAPKGKTPAAELRASFDGNRSDQAAAAAVPRLRP